VADLLRGPYKPSQCGAVMLPLTVLRRLDCVLEATKPAVLARLRQLKQSQVPEAAHAYFAREVTPHVPDAWINRSIVDEQDGKVGKVGYEINFNRYFHQYVPPRPLEEIEAEMKVLEREIVELLREVAG
jgi:type I restriction enzyme M protein